MQPQPPRTVFDRLDPDAPRAGLHRNARQLDIARDHQLRRVVRPGRPALAPRDDLPEEFGTTPGGGAGVVDLDPRPVDGLLDTSSLARDDLRLGRGRLGQEGSRPHDERERERA